MTLRELPDGASFEVQGSGKKPYVIRSIGGVVDCSCPAWRNMGGNTDTRACKHIKANVDPRYIPVQALVRAGMITGSSVANGTPVMSGSNPGAVKVGDVTSFAQKAALPSFSERLQNPPLVVIPPKRAKTPPPIAHAMKWDESINPTGWWMSEKLNGVRAYWNGEDFISKEGNLFHAPDSFKNGLPKVKLDGELWGGRKTFQKTLGAIRKLIPYESEWEPIQFVVFDAPAHTGPFEERQAWLKALKNVSIRNEQWRVLEQERCQSLDHLHYFLQDIEARQGEGVMLRAFESLHESGDTWKLLKVKTFIDAEAEVVGYQPGKGKHKGRLGALVCKMGDGQTFEVGTGLSDKERNNPPKIGSRVTYKYTELTDRGVPRHASFVAVRDYE